MGHWKPISNYPNSIVKSKDKKDMSFLLKGKKDRNKFLASMGMKAKFKNKLNDLLDEGALDKVKKIFEKDKTKEDINIDVACITALEMAREDLPIKKQQMMDRRAKQEKIQLPKDNSYYAVTRYIFIIAPSKSLFKEETIYQKIDAFEKKLIRIMLKKTSKNFDINKIDWEKIIIINVQAVEDISGQTETIKKVCLAYVDLFGDNWREKFVRRFSKSIIGINISSKSQFVKWVEEYAIIRGEKYRENIKTLDIPSDISSKSKQTIKLGPPNLQKEYLDRLVQLNESLGIYADEVQSGTLQYYTKKDDEKIAEKAIDTIKGGKFPQRYSIKAALTKKTGSSQQGLARQDGGGPGTHPAAD